MEHLTENQKDLIKLLYYSEIETPLIAGIVTMMEDDKKLIELVNWMIDNREQIKDKVLEKALEICKLI